MKSYYRHTLFSIVLLLALPCRGQVLPFRSYTMQDGLVSNAISCMMQDSRGFLWIGTMDGISVYDGTTFRNYTRADGLPFSRINHILESARLPGVIWLATNGGGICKFHDGLFESTSIGTTPFSNRVNDLFEDRHGALWIGTDEGLYCRKGDSCTQIGKGILDHYIDRIVPDLSGLNGNDLLWICSSAKLYAYSIGKNRLYRPEEFSLANTSVTNIQADRTGHAWICLDDSSIVEMRSLAIGHRIRSPIARLTSLVEDPDGDFWCGSGEGIFRISQPRSEHPSYHHYALESGLPDNAIIAALLDRENDLWFYSPDNGITRLSKRESIRFPMPISADVGNNANMVVDHAGHVWIASGTHLMEYLQDSSGHWRQTLHEIRLEGVLQQPYSLQIDRSQSLWVRARPAGLLQYRIEGDRTGPSRLSQLRALRQGIDFPNVAPFNFLIDSTDRLWLGIDSLIRLDLHARHPLPRIFTPADGLASLPVWNLALDHRNRVWAGSYIGGVSVYDDSTGRFRLYTTADGLPDHSVRCVYEDRQDRLWIGTRYGGVAMLDAGRFSCFDQRNGMLSNVITSVTEDSRRRIWIGSVAGLQSLSPETSAALPVSSELKGHYIYSCTVTPSGFLVATSLDGIIFASVREDVPNLVPPPVYLSSLRVNERSYPLTGDLTFAHDQNNCLVEFAGVSLRDEGTLTFRYQLLPSDTGWRTAIRARSVAFAALETGTYTFRVKGVNGAGIESLRPAEISFTIRPPFWLSWWFILLSVMSTAAGIFLVVHIREQNITAIERVRSRIASDLHDDVGSGLIRIALLVDVIHRQAALQRHPQSETEGGTEIAPGSSRFDIATVSKNAGTIARELVDTMNDVVWSVDPRNDSLEQFLRRLESFATELCDIKGIAIRFDVLVKDRSLKLGTPALRSMLLVSKESLANIVRHAECSQVVFTIGFDAQRKALVLTIRDNGRGFDRALLSRVNGLENMARRAEKIGASLSIASAPCEGTTVRMAVPL